MCSAILNSCFLSLHKAGVDVNVVMLQESRVYFMETSQQFCYKNVLIPKWYDVWTRIQVITWRLLAGAASMNICL